MRLLRRGTIYWLRQNHLGFISQRPNIYILDTANRIGVFTVCIPTKFKCTETAAYTQSDDV